MNSEAAKPTIKSRLDDLWDTYKWLILAAALILIVIVTLVIQSMTRIKADMALLYVGADGVTEQEASSIQSSFAAIGADVNEDGEYYLELITLTSDASKISGECVYDTNVLTAFNTDVRTFAAVIYIVDTAYYEKLLEYGLLAPLSTVCDHNTDISRCAIDDYGLLYGALNISSLDGFDAFDPDSIICIRRMPEGDEYSYITQEEYQAYVDFFNTMITYTSD